MGRKSLHPGVEIRPSGLRVHFRYQNRPCKEPLDLAPTPANIKHAVRLVAQIKAEIRAGVFIYSATFPNSKESGGGSTVKDYRHIWLRSQSHLAGSTLSSYQSALKVLDRFDQLQPRQVKPSALGLAFEEHGFKTDKGRNNAITPIRGVFALAMQDKACDTNPADVLKFAKIQRGEPDPLSPDEVEAVLGWFRDNRDEQALNYFEFAFFAGLRTSELIGLEWPSVDFRNATARIHQVVVNGEAKAKTKTGTSRDIELHPRALEALKRQKKYTFLAGSRVFHDPLTSRPYVDDKPPRLQWNACLKALGLRHRVAYQTRHTFVTMAIMSGCNPYWVAKQAGHSPKMTFEVYSKWIENADKGREMAKFSGNILGTYVGISGQPKTISDKDSL